MIGSSVPTKSISWIFGICDLMSGQFHDLSITYELTHALLGGGRLNAPLRFFEDSEKTAARSAAGFSPTLPSIFSATFVKILAQGHVRSGHQVRSSDPTTK